MPYSDLQAAPRPVYMPTPLQDLQAPQSFADTAIPQQNLHVAPSHVSLPMLDLSLPQLDLVSDGFNDASGWMPAPYGTYGTAPDPAMPSASVAAMATPVPTAPGIPLDPADDSNVPGMGEAAPQAKETFCENQETAAGFGVSQLPPNDFDRLFEEWDADNAWDVLNQS